MKRIRYWYREHDETLVVTEEGDFDDYTIEVSDEEWAAVVAAREAVKAAEAPLAKRAEVAYWDLVATRAATGKLPDGVKRLILERTVEHMKGILEMPIEG